MSKTQEDNFQVKVFAIESDEFKAISSNMLNQIAGEMSTMLSEYLKHPCRVIMVPKPFKLIDGDTAKKMLKELERIGRK